MLVTSSVIALGLAAMASATPLEKRINSPAAVKQGNYWVINNVGKFSTAKTFTFSGSSLPEGLYASAYTVASTPLAHTFTTANAYVSGGYLNLKIPGGQTGSDITGAEVGTTASNIIYASVRTTAILGEAPGACNGAFFYKDDTQEIDIEFLSDSTSLSNPGDGSRPLHYTNQAVNGDRSTNTFSTHPAPSQPFTTEHEYRVDWIPGKVIFYTDGVQTEVFTTNVPTVAGSWLWNNWNNGDKGWTGAPPTSDNIFKIKQIQMYYNTTSA